MIGVLIIGHDTLPESLAQAVTHVLGARPAQFDVMPMTCADDPNDVLPRAKTAIARLDSGEGVVVFSDIYGATPCNLVGKLIEPGRVEAIAGVNLPMLVRAFTYRTKDLPTMIRKAVSGGCEGVLHIEVDPRYATARS
ncbi:MAG TPA: PTS sugar transporter subunit IIA [Casimicrobiaceae bacterium]|nr:PTS sugar transporter subunit IIA [Casimicrobiaceae bacterium]